LAIDRFHDLLKALNTCFKVFDDLFCQHIRIREIIKVGQTFISDPEDVQTGFVAGNDLFLAKFAPSALGIVFRPGLLSFVSIFRMIAGYEILQIVIGHLVFLFREMDIGPEIIKPDVFCPRLKPWISASGVNSSSSGPRLSPVCVRRSGGPE